MTLASRARVPCGAIPQTAQVDEVILSACLRGAHKASVMLLVVAQPAHRAALAAGLDAVRARWRNVGICVR